MDILCEYGMNSNFLTYHLPESLIFIVFLKLLTINIKYFYVFLCGAYYSEKDFPRFTYDLRIHPWIFIGEI